MPTSFDLSPINELRSLARVVAVMNGITTNLADRTLIVGAAARDLVLHHVHQLPVTRQTVDLDVAVAIGNWQAFNALEMRLVDRGAICDSRAHRFRIEGWSIDVIPFGGVEQTDGVIVWPDTEMRMSVMGFAEASRHALEVLLPGNVAAFVASPPGLLIMKLIAWDERHLERPRHDALDIRTLIDSYAAPWNEERLYEEADDLLGAFGYDNALAAAALLGRDAAAISEAATLNRIQRIIEYDIRDEVFILAADMNGRTEQNIELLRAILTGFQDASTVTS